MKLTNKERTKKLPNNQCNIPEGMIPVAKFSQLRGIKEEKVIEMIKDGFYMGRIVDNNWYINSSELKEESPIKYKQFRFSGEVRLSCTNYSYGNYSSIYHSLTAVNRGKKSFIEPPHFWGSLLNSCFLIQSHW